MSLMRLTIVGLTLSGLIATSTQAETCRPDPPITGSYVNSCSDCTDKFELQYDDLFM